MQKNSESLDIEEKKILTVKYQQPQIKDIPGCDLTRHMRGLLFKINIITGWKIPDDDYFINVLEDQFRQKLIEDYQDCSVAEIEYAMRNYGTSIKDWGRNFNLNLFDMVMTQYKTARTCISELEERLISQERQNKNRPKDEEILSMRRELIEDKYQSFLQGKSSFVLMPEDGIDTLIHDGFCEKDLYVDFLLQAQNNLAKSYTAQIEEAKYGFKRGLINELEERRCALIDVDNIEVKILARKMALMFCFYKFKEAGFKNIYENDK